MTVVTGSVELSTQGEVDIIDVTEDVRRVVSDCGMNSGIACIFTRSSTSTVTTIEYEPGLLRDIPDALERLFPKNMEYGHEQMWHDGNGHSHVRAAFLKPSLTVPFVDGNLLLGTWQQIVFVELDNKRRSRKLIVQMVGE
ncbi:MAG: secondary thiamine-phosphate synthase enzyme YjbQ [Thermoplasmata archaeon]|nr:secondary thiamine-phosphate synthase enzyme YjbQ [Thermoplasmata archaeon]